MNNLKNYKTKLISYLLIFVLIFTLFPFGIVKAEEISGEHFILNNTTIGDKGTMPVVNNSKFIKDRTGKYVLDAGSENRVVYDLGISSSGGTVGTWFKSHTRSKYIIASTDDKNDAILDMYINIDGKLEVAVRDNNTNWKIVVTSSEIVKLDVWNYASIKWILSGSTLNCTLSLNDNEYTGSTCDFKDFTGAKTGIGCYPASSYNIPLMGLIRDFTYREVDATNERIEAAIPLEKNDWNPLSNTWKDVIGKINYKYDENWYYVDVSDINKYLNVVLELPENPSDRGSGMENYDVDLYSFNNGVKKVLATSRSNYSIEDINYKVEQPGRYYIRVYSNRGDSDTEITYTLKTDFKPIIKPYGGEFQGWDYLGYGTKVNPSIPLYLDSSISDEAKVIYKDEEGKEHFYSDIVNDGINIWNKADISGRPKYRDGTPMNIFNLQSSSLFANTIYLFNRTNDDKENTTAMAYCSQSEIFNSGFKIGINYEKFTFKNTDSVNKITNTDGQTKLKEIVAHELGHALGLRDLYIYGYAGINNTDKLMFGYWNLQNLSKNEGSLNIKDKEGLSIIQGWKQQEVNYAAKASAQDKITASASYESVSDSQLYNNSTIILEGTVVSIENANYENAGFPLSKIQFKAEKYFKDSTKSNSDILSVYQDGNTITQFADNTLLKNGDKCILFLTPASDGSFMMMGGPQGRFDILQRNGENVVINHQKYYIKNYLQQKGVDSATIKYVPISDFENTVNNALIKIPQITTGEAINRVN